MLKDQVIVVTGGAGLLGKQFCRSIAAKNGIVIVADKNIESATQTAKDINSDFPDKAHAFSLDITNSESIQNLIIEVIGRFKKIDALVNNAYPRNKNYGRKFEDVCYQDFCENLNLHLGGYFLVAQKFCIYFKEHKKGNVINLSSIYGSTAPKFDIYNDVNFTMPVEYAAIKSGVEHLTRYLAQYYKKNGIRVNSLSPGGIFDSQPAAFLKSYNSYCGNKGMLSPKDLEGGLIFLLSEGSQFMTGQNIVIDDGFSL